MTIPGCFTQNPAGIPGSSTAGGCWSRSGWEPSPRVQPRCLGGPMVGTGMSKSWSSPGTSTRHPGVSRMCCTPGTGRKLPGEGDKGGPGTQHPRVRLRGDPVGAGSESLSGDRTVRVGRSQAPARGLTLKKKKKVYLFQDLPFFFSPPFLLFLPVFQKKWGKSTKKVSCGTAKV